MTTAYIIIAIGVVGVLAIVVSVYLHKKHIHYHEDDLKQAIDEYFDKLGEDAVSERAICRQRAGHLADDTKKV